MSTFKIYFFGLVCHVGEIETEKEYAAVVKAPGHNRYLLWNNGGVPLTDAVKKIAFKFNGAFDPQNAVPDNLFSTFVPQLGNLMGGSIETEGELARHAIKVFYPASAGDGGREGSQLSVAQLYERKAVHVAGGKIVRPLRCVARVTELTVERTEPSMEVYAIDGGGNESLLTTVPDGECLMISSQTLERDQFPFDLFGAAESAPHVHPEDEDTAHEGHTDRQTTAATAGVGAHVHQTGTHVQHYSVIVQENTPNVHVGEAAETGQCDDPDSIACSWVSAIIKLDLRSGTHGECGNTSWP